MLPCFDLQTTTDFPPDIMILTMPCLSIVMGLDEVDTDRAFLNPARLQLEDAIPGAHDCLVCRKRTRLMCSQCNIVRFCTHDCQQKGWYEHETRCFPFSEVVTPVPAGGT